MIKAIYKDTNGECWVNMDYIVDVFPYGNKNVLAFTFDNERGGYIISKAEFEDWNADRPNFCPECGADMRSPSLLLNDKAKLFADGFSEGLDGADMRGEQE